MVLRVEDNGPGVPETIREHLFEPFISQNPGRERLGLGLFLGASLLDMYDGRIWYEERTGGGASFVVEMPPARFTRGQPYHWFAGGDSIVNRIFVIDDEAAMGENIQRMLKFPGHHRDGLHGSGQGARGLRWRSLPIWCCWICGCPG